MKNLFLFLAIAITFFVAMIANYNEIAPLAINVMYTNKIFNLSFLTFCMVVFALGVITGFLLMFRGIIEGANQNKKIRRQLEKTSIGADDSDLRVKTLENKIKTLEAALDKSLNDKNN